MSGAPLVVRRLIQALVFVAGSFGLAHSAPPVCDADVQNLQLVRDAEKQKLVDLFKAAHGKPLDPGVFCTESTGVLTAESAIISYMEENKGRCSFRDDEINKLKARHAGNVDFNAKSCSVAATLEKMKERGIPASGGGRTVVPLVPERGVFTVPVVINGLITLGFLIDSGASDVTVPADIVKTLVEVGTIRDDDFLGKQTYQLADGSTMPSQRFVIHSLQVGDPTIENVVGAVTPVTGRLLLGQSFLSRFKSVSINYELRALFLR
jgi:predicted aspartyl protease